MYPPYNALFIGKVCIEKDRLPSTNTYAQDLLKLQKPIEGTTIITPDQYSGKGQRGNSWQSSPYENITLSIILYPKQLEASRQFALNQSISLGLYDFLKKLIPSGISLKWPNDLYYNDEKLGGILIETSISGAFLNSAVVGIGLNINQTQFPKQLTKATSFQRILGHPCSISSLLPQLFSSVEARYLQLRRGEYSSLQSLYLKSMYRFNEYAQYSTEKEHINARIVDVSPYGHLILENRLGKRSQYHFKEIKFL